MYAHHTSTYIFEYVVYIVYGISHLANQVGVYIHFSKQYESSFWSKQRDYKCSVTTELTSSLIVLYKILSTLDNIYSPLSLANRQTIKCSVTIEFSVVQFESLLLKPIPFLLCTLLISNICICKYINLLLKEI